MTETGKYDPLQHDFAGIAVRVYELEQELERELGRLQELGVQSGGHQVHHAVAAYTSAASQTSQILKRWRQEVEKQHPWLAGAVHHYVSTAPASSLADVPGYEAHSDTPPEALLSSIGWSREDLSEMFGLRVTQNIAPTGAVRAILELVSSVPELKGWFAGRRNAGVLDLRHARAGKVAADERTKPHAEVAARAPGTSLLDMPLSEHPMKAHTIRDACELSWDITPLFPHEHAEHLLETWAETARSHPYDTPYAGLLLPGATLRWIDAKPWVYLLARAGWTAGQIFGLKGLLGKVRVIAQIVRVDSVGVWLKDGTIYRKPADEGLPWWDDNAVNPAAPTTALKGHRVRKAKKTGDGAGHHNS